MYNKIYTCKIIMKIGMTSLSFGKNDINTVFECAKAAGIQGIEWGVNEKHIRIDDDRIKKQCEIYPFKMKVMQLDW